MNAIDPFQPRPIATDDGTPHPVSVRCRAVTKTYRTGGQEVHALRGIDLDVRAGELMMLVGPSGCGKTTLISVIAGILNRDAGECSVFGEDFAKMSSSQTTRFRGRNIGFVFQQFNLLPTLTAVENVAVPLLINGERRGHAIDRAKTMLDRVGLGDRMKTLPSRLSGGQQQRVAIARALVHGPKLLVCDEPTSALDHVTGQRVMEMLRDLALEGGRSVVIVTHDARIFEFADEMAQMDDGSIRKLERNSIRPSPSAATRFDRRSRNRWRPHMIRKYLFPLVAVLGLILAIYTVRATNNRAPSTQPIARPPEAPFDDYVAGAGIVEASTEEHRRRHDRSGRGDQDRRGDRPARQDGRSALLNR